MTQGGFGISRLRLVTVVIGRFEPLVACGLAAALHEDPGLRLLERDLDQANLERAVMALSPTVAILDQEAALTTAAGQTTMWPATAMLALAREPTRAIGMRLLAAGISCVAENVSIGEMRAAIHLIAAGGRTFTSVGAALERRYPLSAPPLTPREAEVLGHLSRGEMYAQIARALGIGVETVRTHATSVRTKLGVAGKQELIGMPHPPDNSRSL
jgi:DNA-binding NarL/FixJ family response regulator